MVIYPYYKSFQEFEKRIKTEVYALKDQKNKNKDFEKVYNSAIKNLTLTDSFNDEAFKLSEKAVVLNALVKSSETYHSETLKVQELKTKFDEFVKDLQLSFQNHSELLSLFYRTEAGILASRLVDGEPCPVCGSVNHPQKAVVETEITKETLEESESEYKSKEIKLQKLSEEINIKIALIKTKREELLKENLLDTTPDEIAKLALEAKIKSDELRLFREKAESEFNKAKSDFELNKALIKEKTINLEKLQASLSEAEENLLNSLKAEGFSSVEEFKDSFIEPNILDAILKKFEELAVKEKESLIRINDYKQKLKDSKPTDVLVLKEQKIKNLENKEINRAKIAEQELILTQNEKVRNILIKTNSEIKSLRKEWAVSEDLYQTVSGTKPGKIRISFETYVQQYYFKKVLASANKRLYSLSEGKYVLRLKKEAKDLKSKSGLDLDVYDSGTGLWRDVSTLSGGESFLASLSLALGLSDTVQNENGGIRLEAMFIDEGFGTLDEETLRKALEVLTNLSEGNRLVGVISHVSEMKEKIDKKLIIKKTPMGSKIRVEL